MGRSINELYEFGGRPRPTIKADKLEKKGLRAPFSSSITYVQVFLKKEGLPMWHPALRRQVAPITGNNSEKD